MGWVVRPFIVRAQLVTEPDDLNCIPLQRMTVELRISHLQKSIVEQRKEAKKSEKDFQETERDRSKLRSAIDDLKSRLNMLKYDPVRRYHAARTNGSKVLTWLLFASITFIGIRTGCLAYADTGGGCATTRLHRR